MAQGAAKIAPLMQPADGIEPGRDGPRVGQRPADTLVQAACARGRHRAVDGGDQGALTTPRLGPVDFEGHPRRLIDRHEAGLSQPARGLQSRQLAGLGRLDIGGNQAQRRHLGRLEIAEAVQRRGPVEPLDPIARRARLGQGLGHRLNHAARRLQRRRHGLVGKQTIPRQGLGGSHRGQGRPQLIARHRQALDLAGGNLDRRQGRPVAAHRHRRQPVGAAGVEQTVLGQGAGRHHPHHITPDHRFGAALLGLGGIFHLFADRDLEPGPDQPRQIAVDRMDRHPGHGDVTALMLAAPRQGDAQYPGGRLGILEEQLVEVTHAEKQQGVGLARLGGQVLGHHRAGVDGDGRGRGGVHEGAQGGGSGPPAQAIPG